VVFRSETIKNNLNPVWKMITLGGYRAYLVTIRQRRKLKFKTVIDGIFRSDHQQ
jgi:hypothetical protein